MSVKKLIIQIPCKDEAETLAQTIAEIPRKISGVEKVEILVVDDGSSDQTAQKAVALGVEHVLRFATNRGLARNFDSGLRFAVFGLEADLVVNTDGDNQYRGSYIKDMVEALLEGHYGMVVGQRDLNDMAHFSLLKKAIIKAGSKVIGILSGFSITDAPSGFRAFSRQAAMRLTILSQYTYTMETLVQAKSKGIRVGFVPVKTNSPLRSSHLMKSILDYLIRTFISLIVIILLYRPELVFWLTSILSLLLAIPVFFFPHASFYGLAAVMFFLSGLFFSVLSKMLVTHRIVQEEQLLWMTPSMSASACAVRLGAANYYHQGRDLLHE